MSDQFILPLSSNINPGKYRQADEEYAALVNAYLDDHIKIIQKAWSQPDAAKNNYSSASSSALADQITNILTQRAFNYRSRGKLSPLLSNVRHTITNQVLNGSPLKLYLLYNGGYRASSVPDKLSLIFEPDQTELMLLYQITLLHKKISAVYDAGIEFSIVINNGVAHWVNDIPLANTLHYAHQLRNMIEFMGAEKRISVLVQSELEGFEPQFSLEPSRRHVSLSDAEHGIVERFLGRSCSRDEAMYRYDLYMSAESKWEKDLSPIVMSEDVLMLRQVAHPQMLSFRPFPGGAIRTQNGSLGFESRNKSLTPKLITSQNTKEHGFAWVPYHLPWSIKEQHVKSARL